MNKKIGYSLLAILLLLVIVLSFNINRLQAHIQVREEAINNLVREASIEQLRDFRLQVERKRESSKAITSHCKKGRGYIPAQEFLLICG